MRQAAAVSIVSTPMPASISGRSNAGAGKRRRAPLPKMTSSGLQRGDAREVIGARATRTTRRATRRTVAAPRHDDALGVLDAVDDDAFGAVAGDRVLAFDPVGAHFHDVIIGGGVGVARTRRRAKARPLWSNIGLPSGPRIAGVFFVQPLLKSSKLANVCYDIRGPVLEKARQMEEEGQHIIKLNIGNIAAFGLEPPDEIVQDMIRNLPNAAGYTDSKGLFAPRKAIVHYTQQKHVKGVTRRRRLPRQRRLRADHDEHERAAQRRRRGADPGARLPALDGVGRALGRNAGALPLRRGERLAARPRRHGREDHAADARASSSSIRTTRPARSIPTSCSRRSSRSRASTA